MSRKTKTLTLFRLMFVLAAVVGVTLLMSLSLPASKAASIYTVNSLLDTDDGACDAANCTLREAINASNLDPGSTISFSVTGTITLGSALPPIEQTVTINGPGASQLTVSGNNTVRVFHVKSGVVTTFNGLTMSNGNTGASGGGIFVECPSVVNISNSIITDNTAASTGGAIAAPNIIAVCQLNIANTTISGNSAGLGGGINSGSSNLTVSESTISGNSAQGVGGGIASQSFVTISNSTISGNNSSSLGGGMFTGASPLTMKNSTVTGNSSTTAGGGLAADSGQISNSTISGNSAPVGSGVYAAFGMPTFSSNIIALNIGGGNDVSHNTLTPSGGYNVIGTSNGITWTPTDQLGVTAAQLQLGPLGNNGGPTETMALACGSVAIDKGINVSASANDQRGPGFARTFDDPNTTNAAGGDGTDAGAFEVQAACANPPANKDQCKNNGWQTVSRPDGTPFKNQGDCIQFVNTGK